MNSATRLAFLFKGWTVPKGEYPETARALEGKDLWPVQMNAVFLLADVMRSISALRDDGVAVSVYQEHVEEWHRAVFAYNTPWQSLVQGPRRAANETAVSVLETLGHLLDARNDVEADLDEEKGASVVAVLDDSEREIMAAQLPIEERRYILALIREARACCEEVDKYGSARARRVIFELGGAMITVAGAMQDEPAEKRNRIAHLALRLMGFVASASTKAMITSIATGEVQKMIGH